MCASALAMKRGSVHQSEVMSDGDDVVIVESHSPADTVTQHQQGSALPVHKPTGTAAAPGLETLAALEGDPASAGGNTSVALRPGATTSLSKGHVSMSRVPLATLPVDARADSSRNHSKVAVGGAASKAPCTTAGDQKDGKSMEAMAIDDSDDDSWLG